MDLLLYSGPALWSISRVLGLHWLCMRPNWPIWHSGGSVREQGLAMSESTFYRQMDGSDVEMETWGNLD